MGCISLETIRNAIGDSLQEVQNNSGEFIKSEDFVQRVINEFRKRFSESQIDEENVNFISEEMLDALDMWGINLEGIDQRQINDQLLQKTVLTPVNEIKVLAAPQDIKEENYNIRSKTFIDEYYGQSLASQYMLDKFTRDFIKNTLVDFESNEIESANDINDINTNLRNYQNNLYKDLKDFIESEKDLHTVNMPDELFNSDGSNNFKLIYNQLDYFFKQYNPRDLSNMVLNKNKEYLLDIINKYFILKHFDQLVLDRFGSFLNIGEIYFGKHSNYGKKYSFNTSHDYQNAISWRNDEKATPKDVMSHHLQYIIQTIPYYDSNGEQHGYLDTDVVIYAIKQLKDIYLKGKLKNNDAVFSASSGVISECKTTGAKDENDEYKFDIIYTKEEEAWLRSLGSMITFTDIVSHLRDNAQLGYSILFKIVKSKHFKDNNEGIFNQDLVNIMDSLYDVVFNNNRVLNNAPNIFQELTHFLDFTTNLENTQYYKDDANEWQIRTMNPMNIETNKYILRNSINSLHAPGQMDYYIEKYEVEYNNELPEGAGIENKNITMKFYDKNGKYQYIIKYFPAKASDKVEVYRKNKSQQRKITEYTEEDYNNFKEFIKDAISINLFNDIDLQTELLRDAKTYNLLMQKLVSFSSSVFGNAFIMRKESKNRWDLEALAKEWGLQGTSEDTTDIAFRSNLGTFNIIGKAQSHNLSWLAERRGIAKRQAVKTTTYTAENTMISSNSLSNYSAERRNQYIHLNENSAVKKDMLTDLLGWGINREVELTLTGKQTHTFNFNELLYSSFQIDFLTGYKNANGKKVCRFVEAVNADKPNSPRIEIDFSEVFDTIKGIPKDAEYFYKKTVDTFSEIYATTWKNILLDYSALEQHVADQKKLNIDREQKGYSKHLEYIPDDFTIDVNNDFENFNATAKSLGKTGSELLREICLDYNEFHFNNPIAIIENVHKRNNKDGDLELNKAFITNLLRFNQNTTNQDIKIALKNLSRVQGKLGTKIENGKIVANDYWLDQFDLNNYFRRNELRLVDDLLTEGARITIDSDTQDTSGWKAVLDNSLYLGWKKNGEMIFAKVYLKDGREISVNDYTDLIGFTSDGYDPYDARFDFAGNLKYNGEEIDHIDIHPALRSWTAADGYYSGKYQTANVGLTVFSDPKKEINGDYEEEGAVGDYVKRNVINTATMKQFQLGTLGGITDYLNIAIVEDIKALLNNIVTDESEYKVWDGATITAACQHYWENNSLSGSITGFTKKPIMHHYFDKYAAGYLQKTASFAINNEKMRDSILYRAMHYKTSNIEWRNQNGIKIKDTDITKAFDGSKIDYSDCFYRKDGKYYKINSIVKTNKVNNKDVTNGYRITVQEVDQTGVEKNVATEEFEFVINSNYKLWQALGGYNSMSLSENEGLLEFSEKSIQKVADVACKVGIPKNRKSNEKILTQQGVYQFMKHSNIHYIATEGAVKKGAANVNKYESLNNSDKLNFFKVRANLFGIQLDPTHEADNAEVSLMTQVISGLADRGFSTEAVNDVYTALGRLAKEAIATDIDIYKKLLGDNENIENRVANEIVSAFRDQLGTANNLILEISKRLSKLKYDDNKQGLIPWSDPSIFNLIANTTTSTLNKMAIRVKSFGSLSVLNPSHDTIQLFDNKKLSQYSSPKVLYDKGLEMLKAPEIKNHKLYIGHYYQYVENNKTKYIKLTLDNYYNITNKLDNKKISGLRETILGEETVVTGEDLNKDHFGLFKLYTRDSKTGELNERITYINGKIYDPINGLKINANNYERVVKVELLGRDLDTYNVFVNDGQYTLYDLKSVHDRYELRKEFDNIIKSYKDGKITKDGFKQLQAQYTAESHKLLRLIQKDLVKIKNENKDPKISVQFIDNRLTKEDAAKINNGEKISKRVVNIKPISYETSAYGILVPMVYMSKFGLRKDDQLSDILEDEEFFFKRLLQNYADLNLENKQVLRGNYDFVIKRLNNKNIYLQTKESNLKNKNLKEINIDIHTDSKGRLYRYDAKGNKMYQVSSENDKVFVDYNNTNLGEIIVTDDAGIKFYIDKYAKGPQNLQIRKQLNKKNSENEQVYKERIDKILQTTKFYNKDLSYEDNLMTYDSLSTDDTEFIRNYLKNGMKASGMDQAIRNNRKFKSLWDKSQRIRTSFQASLDFLAARIPAQSMQSFMTMKVEGFTNVGINDCYISDMQVWLQGSDFDVDKVTLMGKAFTNFGELKTWSKYIRYQDVKELEITSQIKFPTGKETEVIDSRSRKYEKYKSLFVNKKGELKLNIERPVEPIRSEDDSTDQQYNEFITARDEYYGKLRLLVNMLNEYSTTLEGRKSPLRDAIQKIVDDHNTQEIDDIEQVLMNLVQDRAVKISRDIVNIIPSQNPIDVVSEPLKERADESNFGRKDRFNRYGNAAVKLKQLLINQTGKSGISITAASGIKTFFALTQFFNQRTNKNLSDEELNNLIFAITIGGKEYHTISNINKIKKEIDINPNLKEKFNKYVDESDQVDADAVISGIMTLATDNAKELKLAKLNASSDILGLYLYGVTIGVPFDSLVNIFTSNTADVLNKRMYGNVFNDESDKSLGVVLHNLRVGPLQPMTKDRSEPHKDIRRLLGYGNTNPMNNYEKSIVQVINNIKDQLLKIDNIEERKQQFGEHIYNLITIAKSITSKDYKVQRYKEEVIDYIRDMYRIYGDGNFERNALSDIEQLFKGSQEIGVLRTLILNQGVKVMVEDKLSFYDSFSSIIEQRLPKKATEEDVKPNVAEFYRNNNNSYKIDLIKYCTNDNYRQLVINAYEDVKHTINPFRVIDGLPHFREYLNAAAVDAIKLGVSSVFKATREYSNFIFDKYNVYETKARSKYYKRMRDFYIRKIQDEFLKNYKITLDDNAQVYYDGKYQKIKGSPTVTLGTVEGNIAFKNWVESTVIPKLQSSDGYFMEENTFITDLIPKLYTRTLSRNRIRSMSLPFDMIPKTELEQKVFDRYQMDYITLSGIPYKSDTRYTIADILYLYNMITYGNSKNLISLTPITDTLYSSKGSVADSYSKFLADFDSNHSIKLNTSSDIKDGDIVISEDELLQQVAPDSFEIKNHYSYRGPYVRIYSKDTGDRLLYSIKKQTLEKDKAALEQKRANRRRKNSMLDNPMQDVYDYQYNSSEYTEYSQEYDNYDAYVWDSPLNVQQDAYDDYIQLDVGDENVYQKRAKVTKRDKILTSNYEPVRTMKIDTTALETLGRFQELDNASSTEVIFDIDSSYFGNYLVNQVRTQLQSGYNINIDYTYGGIKDKLQIDIVKKGKKYEVKVNDKVLPISAKVTTSTYNKSRSLEINQAELLGEIKETIRQRMDIQC